MEPIHDLANIKRLRLIDLAKKRRQFRYELKKGLNLKDTDTVEFVVSRAETAPIFDAEDFEIQVDRWLSSVDKVFLFI
jgi:16S rRNA G527 N7-methylase RsmG